MQEIDYIYEVWSVCPVTIEHERHKVYLTEEKAQEEVNRLNDIEKGEWKEYYLKKTKIDG